MRYLLVTFFTIVVVICADQLLWLAPYFLTGGSDTEFNQLCGTFKPGDSRMQVLDKIADAHSVRLEMESSSDSVHQIAIERDLTGSCEIQFDADGKVKFSNLRITGEKPREDE